MPEPLQLTIDGRQVPATGTPAPVSAPAQTLRLLHGASDHPGAARARRYGAAMSEHHEDHAVPRLAVSRLAVGNTQRVPLPPPLLGGEVSVGARVVVYQRNGPEAARMGTITALPHLRSNRATVRYDA